MPEPVRVRDNTTRHEYSTYAVTLDGRVDEGLTVIDEPAVDAQGAILPPKYPAKAPAPAARVVTSPGRPATDKES